MSDYDVVFPCTVTPSRYSGVYETDVGEAATGDLAEDLLGLPRALWLAFPEYPANLPEEAFSGDGTCERFFRSRDSARVGRGPTPNAAVDDMIRRGKLHG